MRERNIHGNIFWLPFVCAPTGDRPHNPGMCLMERNRLPFALQDDNCQGNM